MSVEAIPGVTVGLRDLIKLRSLTPNLRLAGGTRPVSGSTGPHLANQKGRGLEFDEVRAYQAGDDVRTIDWRVTARRGRPHTKLFREERERPLLVFADLHPGMFFGTRHQFKSVLASRLAALAAWLAAEEGDRVGGVIAAGASCTVLPPRPRRAGVLRLLNELVALQPSKPRTEDRGYLDVNLAKLSRIVHPGAMILLLSDFSGLSRDGQRYLHGLASKSDVLAGFIYDPLEAEPPKGGRYRFGTPAKQVIVDTSSARVADSWRQSFQRRLALLRDMSRRSLISLVEISTEMEPGDFFAQRHLGRKK